MRFRGLRFTVTRVVSTTSPEETLFRLGTNFQAEMRIINSKSEAVVFSPKRMDYAFWVEEGLLTQAEEL